MSSPDLTGNIAAWTKANAEYTDAQAERGWHKEEFTWGVFGVPESEIGAIGDVAGLDVVELGCGTAYLSAWLARQGARVTGVDPTPAQLATARRMREKTGLAVELVEAPGEAVPLPDAAFDLAISEYGASLWADPYKWIPEAARMLRSGGRLVFLTNSTIAYLCSPPVGTILEQLQLPQRGMYRTQWPGEPGTEYHLAHSEWIELLRANGFEIEALHELYAPDGAVDHEYYAYVTAEWARKWPVEELWVARKR